MLAGLSRSYHQALAQNPRFIVADGYWYKYAVTELALTGDSSTFKVAEAIFPNPRLAIFLDVKPEEALRRKREFSTYESGFSDEDSENSFIKFQTRIYDKWQTMLSLSSDWYTINSQSHSIDSITQQIKLLIQ